MNRRKLKKIYFLPNVFTAFGLTCGLFVIFKMNMTPVGEVNSTTLIATAGILMLAALADLFDGAIARAMSVESDFGGLFDSLSDAITFGVAPSVIILKSLSIHPGTTVSFVVTATAIIYSVCGVLRLVRFSVSALEAKGNEELETEHKKYFTGLPIPVAATAAVSMNLLLFSEDLNGIIEMSDLTRVWILSSSLVLLGYCMISRWKFPSAKNLKIRVASFQTVLWTVVCAVLIFFGFLNHFAVAFFMLAWSYVLIAMTISCIRVLKGEQAKASEDFELTEEDED